MSYCRWSTDDFQCDLYVYEDMSGGYTVNVAANRVEYKEELPKPIDLTQTTDFDAWVKRQHYVDQMRQLADFVPIGLPLDGATFNVPTLADLKTVLLELRKVGYKFPDYVLDNIQAEIDDQGDVTSGQDSIV